MRALVRLASGDAPDCTRCATDPDVRAEFGCDGPARLDYAEPPARQPTAWISCTCGGRDPTCTRCDAGMRPLFHCPRRLVEQQEGWRIQDSKLVYEEFDDRRRRELGQNGQWFLHLSYQQPRQSFNLPAERRAVLTLLGHDKAVPSVST